MDIRNISHNFFQLTINSNIYLTIATSIKNERIPTDTDGKQPTYCGWIVRDGEIFPWYHDIVHINEEVHIIGPYLNGIALSEILKNNQGVFGYVSRMARALEVLESKNIDLDVIHTQAVIFLMDDGVLFLANGIVSLLCNHQLEDADAEYWQPFNHPRRDKYKYSAEQRYSFAIATLAYYALCQSRPWIGSTGEELTKYVCSGVVPLMYVYDPYLNPDIVHKLHAVLSRPKGAPPSLQFWRTFFHECILHGTHVQVDDGEAQRRMRAAHILFRRVRKKRILRVRMYEHVMRMCAVALFLLVLMVTPYVLIKVTVQRATYQSLPAEDVAARYYEAVDSLDLLRIKETLHPEYEAPIVPQLDDIYRASRVGMIVRFQSPYRHPNTWIDAGRPELNKRYAVYGIDNLTLTELSRSENAAEIMAAYRYWLPEQFAESGTINTRARSQIAIIKERISLRMHNDRWVITSIAPME